jgi:small subunit ribosomal protein S1
MRTQTTTEGTYKGGQSEMDQQRTDLQQRFSALLESDYNYTNPQRGDIREATILSVTENEVFVDIGGKRDGIIPRQDLDLLDDDYRTSLQTGDRVPVCIQDTRTQGDGIMVSLNQGLAQQDWLQAEALLENGGIYKAEVIDVNRGGVLVSFGRMRGFVPNSHLSSVPPGLRGEHLQEAKSELIGRTLSLTVIEVNQRQRRLVLSERAANHRQRQQLLEALSVDETLTGTVRNLVNFGAFVDLGGMDGLIHISELDWGHVEHPGDVLSVGDKVEVQVLNVDYERGRVELSRKRLLPDPWSVATEKLQVDQLIEGTVTKIVEFGAFVNIGNGIEGLIHTSEMPNGKTMLEDLEPDSPIKVRILGIDQRRHRVALSMQGISDANLAQENVEIIEG